MIHKLGILFSNVYLKYMPNAFVFAILLTFITGFGSHIWLEASIFDIFIFIIILKYYNNIKISTENIIILYAISGK